ncbi:response regulator transcription factor [Sphingomonas sp. Y38-1Y]|uniref:response regulator transcription factor n=1 Tax=Sphingomonas sp. Y38-1Y TaxID=3078265 RepID=UPI0028F027F1|nr:response regulator transcription factor [Sphingomonas sp. Y38-1Y]
MLVVEHQPTRRAEYVLALVEGGYAVRAVTGPQECRMTMSREAVDVVLLDLDHPALGARDLPRQLGTTGRAGLIGVGTATRPEERIAAIEAGCDDLVALPVHPGELCARTGALLRRRTRPRRFDLAGLLLDLDARTLSPPGGRPTPLTRGEFTLLELLTEAGGAVVGRETLCGAIARRGDEIDPRTADALVRRIRRKLEPLVEGPVIATVQGAGYRLAVSVRAR